MESPRCMRLVMESSDIGRCLQLLTMMMTSLLPGKYWHTRHILGVNCLGFLSKLCISTKYFIALLSWKRFLFFWYFGQQLDSGQYEAKYAQCDPCIGHDLLLYSRSSPPLTSSRCDFHLVIFIYMKWNCEISASQCTILPIQKKGRPPLSPAQLPALQGWQSAMGCGCCLKK